MRSQKVDIELIKSEITKTLEVLDGNVQYYREFMDSDFKALGEKKSSAIVIAEIMTDYYTCLETLFLRISQFFENNLDTQKWHKDLLHKMTLNIETIRIAVISDKTFDRLSELLKFRHFQRYYYELNYDWERIRFLQMNYEAVIDEVKKDLQQFREFLNLLANSKI